MVRPPSRLRARREVHQEFLIGVVKLETVDSTRFELGHVLRTNGLPKGHLTAAQYRAAVRSIDDLGITIHSTDADALERAGELAARCMLFDIKHEYSSWAA